MIHRRDLLIGGACALAASGALALTPRKRMQLLGDRELDALIPRTLGAWKAVESDALIVPQTESSLANRIYNQSVGRAYVDPAGNAVMLLIAYGRTQNDTLQLHRPEICYPAIGFEISDNRPTRIALGEGRAAIPGRIMSAHTDIRTEQILYWTRIGEYLPISGAEQRERKFALQLRGVVPDGILVRVSNTRVDQTAGEALNRHFATDLLTGCSPEARRVLVGTAIANALGRNGGARDMGVKPA